MKNLIFCMIAILIVSCEKNTTTNKYIQNIVPQEESLAELTTATLRVLSFEREIVLKSYRNNFQVSDELHSCTFSYLMSDKEKSIPAQHPLNVVDEEFSREDYKVLSYKGTFQAGSPLTGIDCRFDYQEIERTSWQTVMTDLLIEDLVFLAPTDPQISSAPIHVLSFQVRLTVPQTENKISFVSKHGTCELRVPAALDDRNLDQFSLSILSERTDIYSFGEFRFRYNAKLKEGPLGAEDLDCSLNHTLVHKFGHYRVIEAIVKGE